MHASCPGWVKSSPNPSIAPLMHVTGATSSASASAPTPRHHWPPHRPPRQCEWQPPSTSVMLPPPPHMRAASRAICVSLAVLQCPACAVVQWFCIGANHAWWYPPGSNTASLALQSPHPPAPLHAGATFNNVLHSNHCAAPPCSRCHYQQHRSLNSNVGAGPPTVRSKAEDDEVTRLFLLFGAGFFFSFTFLFLLEIW